MDKDKTIIDFINKLKIIINFSLIKILDYWDGDRCAIGLKKGNKLVYISTYNFYNEIIIIYDYDFEIIDETLSDKIKILKEGRSIFENEIINEIQLFFGF